MYHKGIKVAKIKILFPIYSQPNKKKDNNNAIINCSLDPETTSDFFNQNIFCFLILHYY